MKTTLNGIEIDVRSDESLFVTIGNKVVYIDDSLDELIIDTWLSDDEHDEQNYEDLASKVKTMENVPFVIVTSGKLYTREVASDLFKGCVSPENLPFLLDHICVEPLAEDIDAFFEDEGILTLNVGGEYLTVIKNTETKVA